MTQVKPRHVAGAMGACALFVAGFEGVREHAYRDVSPARVWTVCAGETAGVRAGDHYTRAECIDMLEKRLEGFSAGVRGCLKEEQPQARMIALTSLAYNIGTGAFCSSSVARLINAGETRAACDAILKWNRAGGIVFPGLTRRRQAERALCLEGL